MLYRPLRGRELKQDFMDSGGLVLSYRPLRGRELKPGGESANYHQTAYRPLRGRELKLAPRLPVGFVANVSPPTGA